jgi:CheY-like chemotaxis protein
MRKFAERPKTGPNRRLLVVEDNEEARMSIEHLIDGDGDIEIVAISTGAEALEKLKTEQFDCAIIDLGLPDMSGFDLIQTIRKDLGQEDLPIIVYTARDLTKRESTQLNKLAEAVILKDMTSIDKLLEETSLFLHRVETNLPEEKRKRLDNIHNNDTALANKKVLIVDDDVRNIFAITSFLERHNMLAIYAENGRDALDLINKTTDIDVVLMDIMMPGMDGYETMRQIRKNRRFKAMPIIAVTAKAMRGDREKCIEAGASDYITKPVDVDQLLSLLRVWLFK